MNTIESVLISVILPIVAGLSGNWTGESVCTIKDSPCHDEHVIYRVEEPDADGKMKIQMDKVVKGKAELMGTVNCTFENTASTITCTIQSSVWRFTVNGDRMEGTLTREGGQIYRRISVKKDK